MNGAMISTLPSMPRRDEALSRLSGVARKTSAMILMLPPAPPSASAVIRLSSSGYMIIPFAAAIRTDPFEHSTT